jgi:hypothetical protein
VEAGAASPARTCWKKINAGCLDLLSRAQREGLLNPAADLEWTRQVYYALLGEAP